MVEKTVSERKDHQQVHNRNVRDARVELEHKYDPRDQQGAHDGQHAIEQILFPGNLFAFLDGREMFNSTHSQVTFLLRCNALQ